MDEDILERLNNAHKSIKHLLALCPEQEAILIVSRILVQAALIDGIDKNDLLQFISDGYEIERRELERARND